MRNLKLLIIIILTVACSGLRGIEQVAMREFENGFIPGDSMSFFQHPVLDITGNEILIEDVVSSKGEESWIICISSPEC